MSELYALLVLRYHIPPSYALDEMEMYEISSLMKYEYYAHKDDWEQTRFLGYMVAQVNSRKKLSLEDIIPFYWEKENDSDTSISSADLERLKIMAENYIKNNGRNSD